MDNPFQANWSSQGHTLCLGHWQITYLGLPVTLPQKYAEKDMNTRDNFSFMFPDEDEFIEGIAFPEWLEANVDWLLAVFEKHNIPSDPEHFELFYMAVNQNDWRCSSCGGCI